MLIESNRPEGCQAAALGLIVPSPVHRLEEIGNMVVLCGDRRIDFPLPDDRTRDIKFAIGESTNSRQLVQLASDILTGFCVDCPHRRATD